MNNLRTADMAARYGGEELAAVLPHTGCRSATTVAGNIHRAVDTRFEEDLGATISVGIADPNQPTHQIDPEAWNQVIRVSVTGVFLWPHDN